MKPEILVVDDDQEQLRLFQMVLSDDGFRVSSASGGVEALNTLRRRVNSQLVYQRHPDLLRRSKLPSAILMDVKMPSMDGITTARMIKANRVIQQVPIVFVTAYSHLQLLRMNNDIDKLGSVIEKPFDIDDLLHKVHDLTGRPV